MRARVLFAASAEWRELGAQFGAQFDALRDGPTFTGVKATSRTQAGFLTYAGQEVFVKRVAAGGYGRGLLARIFGSRARRALAGARLLAQAGFGHPRPLLMIETLSAGAIRASYVVTEPLRTAQVLSRFALGRTRPPRLRRRVSQQVGAAIRRLHDAGIYTRDMQETNLMIEERNGELALYFVDLEDFRRIGKVSMELRMLNLVHLDRSVGRFVSRAQRLRFFYDYLGWRPARDETRRLVRQYVAVRTRVERRGGKRTATAGFSARRPRTGAIVEPRDLVVDLSGTAARKKWTDSQVAAAEIFAMALPVFRHKPDQHTENVHAPGGFKMREVMLGLNDGLVAAFAVTSGVAAAFTNPKVVVMAGMAEMLGGAVSMGLAAYASARAQYEFYQSERQREHDEIRRWPEREREEIRGIYRSKGFSGPLLEQIVSHITADPMRWRDVMMSEELGFGTDVTEPPSRSALFVGTSYLVGAAVPLLPYLFIAQPLGILASAIATVAVLFVVGAAKTLLTARPWWRSGLESMSIGIAAALVTYGAGLLFAER